MVGSIQTFSVLHFRKAENALRYVSVLIEKINFKRHTPSSVLGAKLQSKGGTSGQVLLPVTTSFDHCTEAATCDSYFCNKRSNCEIKNK